MKRGAICLIIATGMMLVYSCQQHEERRPNQVKTMGTISVTGSVHEMTLNPYAAEFPEHPGKTEFVSYCGICHSLKYISMQPDFPRKTWDAEVHKMVEKYGAPIDSTISRKIVDYLVTIKG